MPQMCETLSCNYKMLIGTHSYCLAKTKHTSPRFPGLGMKLLLVRGISTFSGLRKLVRDFELLRKLKCLLLHET